MLSDPIIATAILDRLLHHSTTVNIRGESYRLKERHKAGLIPQPEQQQPELPAVPGARGKRGHSRVFQGIGKSINPMLCLASTGGTAFNPASAIIFDEFAASYSLADCSPAESTSASPAGSISTDRLNL